jgi:hypothetical protein
MAFRQYTRCVSPTGFVSLSRLVRITAVAVVFGGAAALVAVVAGEPWSALIGLEIGGLVALIAYCRIWLNNRLICIADDVEVVGVVASLSPPSRSLRDLDWDNDYSVNLLLQDAPFGATQAQAEQSQPYGGLVAPHHTISAIGRATPGHAAQHGTGPNKILSFGLHVEFEGRGNKTLFDAAVVALAVAIAALVAGLAWSGRAAAILATVSALIMLLAAVVGKFVGAGSPADANPSLGDLHPIELDANNKPLPGADIVYVRGTWVYDSLHEGWNEIHPVKACAKAGTWTGNWATQPPINLSQVRV